MGVPGGKMPRPYVGEKFVVNIIHHRFVQRLIVAAQAVRQTAASIAQIV